MHIHSSEPPSIARHKLLTVVFLWVYRLGPRGAGSARSEAGGRSSGGEAPAPAALDRWEVALVVFKILAAMGAIAGLVLSIVSALR